VEISHRSIATIREGISSTLERPIPLNGGPLQVRSRVHHGMVQTRGCIASNAAAHPQKQLVALDHRVHLRITLLVVVLVAQRRSACGLGMRGAWSVEDRGIKVRSFPWPPANFVYNITALSLSI